MLLLGNGDCWFIKSHGYSNVMDTLPPYLEKTAMTKPYSTGHTMETWWDYSPMPGVSIPIPSHRAVLKTNKSSAWKPSGHCQSWLLTAQNRLRDKESPGIISRVSTICQTPSNWKHQADQLERLEEPKIQGYND